MKLSLRQRLEKYFRNRPKEVISGGEIERIVLSNTTYKASNVSRRLREMTEEGLLTPTYPKGFVCYQWQGEFDPIKFFDNYKCQCAVCKNCPCLAKNHHEICPKPTQLSA